MQQRIGPDHSSDHLTQTLTILLKITIVIFMAGNLVDLGLRVDLKEALRGLRDVRFSGLSVLWAFVLCPALNWFKLPFQGAGCQIKCTAFYFTPVRYRAVPRTNRTLTR
jgi:hypothetical protein